MDTTVKACLKLVGQVKPRATKENRALAVLLAAKHFGMFSVSAVAPTQ